jgi:hypothetical protein
MWCCRRLFSFVSRAALSIPFSIGDKHLPLSFFIQNSNFQMIWEQSIAFLAIWTFEF